MAAPSARATRTGLSLTAPLRALWWLLQSPRWAAAVTALVAGLALLGVLLPQLPFWMRGDAAAEAAWLAQQRQRLGPAADWLWRLGLLDVFHAPWFAAALGLLLASTAAYVVGRLPGIWAGIVRPRLRVPDSYFATAPHRLEAEGPVDATALAAALRRSLYRVVPFREGAVTYLFADRFPWASLGTLLGHGAVPLFIVAAAIGSAGSFDTAFLVAEGQSRPVLPAVASPRQMLVRVEDVVGRFDPRGTPLEYRSELAIYRQGELVKRCQVTVNSPCSYDGYRFFQAGYFGYGAEVQVRDLRSGDVLYRETLALEFQRPAPFLRVRDASGTVLFEGTLPLGEPVRLDLGQGPADVSLASLTVGGQGFLVGLQTDERGRPRLLVAAGERGGAVPLEEGQRARTGGLEWELARLERLPAARVTGFPLPAGREGDGALLQMTDVAYGTANAAEGVREGLALAARRGTLVQAQDREGGLHYAINTPAHRRALASLRPAPAPPVGGPPANIFRLYEDNIGTITPLIAEELRQAEERYPWAWIEAAFREAVELNRRNWRYIKAILRRWEVEGPSHETPGRDLEVGWLAERYRRGKRRRPYSAQL